MATLSKTASVLHELGLAAGFGSTLFGLLALSPAMATIQSKRERGKVTHVAWERYRTVNASALALMVGTWFGTRVLPMSRTLGEGSRALITAKDVLVGGALVAGVGSIVVGQVLDKEMAASNQPLTMASRPYAVTRQRVAKLEQISNGLGRVNVLLSAAVLSVTALLAIHSRAR